MSWRAIGRWLGVACFATVLGLRAAETIPPAPQNHFNDYAGVVAPAIAQQLNAALTQFERDTSNQLLVAIFPHLQSDSSIEDYTVRVAQAWKVGQADQKNGAVLFIFTQDRKLYLQVGYGLEGVLPDARCKQIIENEIKPRFRAGDYSGGVAAGVQAMMASVRGEYRGSGRTAREARGGGGMANGLVGLLVLVVIVISSLVRGRRNTLLGSHGRRGVWVTPPWGGGGGGWGGGSSGGGSFSGGGGSFGGGGAGGSW